MIRRWSWILVGLMVLGCGRPSTGSRGPVHRPSTAALGSTSSDLGETPDTSFEGELDSRSMASTLAPEPPTGVQPPGDEVEPLPPPKPVLVTVHGFKGTPEDFGDPTELQAFASSLGAELFSYTWHTGVLDSDLQPLETQAALFRAALEPYLGRPIWIVGHSTGGLIARQALLDLLAEGWTRPFERLALIAVPHYGVLANLLPNLLTERNPQLAQLRFGSSFLVQLQRRWQACLDENYPGGCADQLPAMVSVGGAFALPVEGDLHAYVDGTVTAASAWLPGTPLVLLQHLHPDLANVTASPETAGLLGRFFGPACQANPLTCLEDLETGGTLLERFPPQFLFVYPEAWGDPEVLFEPWFEPVAPLPSLLGRGWCCDEDQTGTKRYYVLDRTFSERLTSAGLEGWEELAVSFLDRSCGVPVRELLSLLEDRRTVILEFGAADGRGACRTKTW